VLESCRTKEHDLATACQRCLATSIAPCGWIRIAPGFAASHDATVATSRTALKALGADPDIDPTTSSHPPCRAEDFPEDRGPPPSARPSDLELLGADRVGWGRGDQVGAATHRATGLSHREQMPNSAHGLSAGSLPLGPRSRAETASRSGEGCQRRRVVRCHPSLGRPRSAPTSGPARRRTRRGRAGRTKDGLRHPEVPDVSTIVLIVAPPAARVVGRHAEAVGGPPQTWPVATPTPA
jgi:hypothetical protein